MTTDKELQDAFASLSLDVFEGVLNAVKGQINADHYADLYGAMICAFVAAMHGAVGKEETRGFLEAAIENLDREPYIKTRTVQ